MVYIVENNGVYGLTKGQFSATADRARKSKRGAVNTDAPIDLVGMALLLAPPSSAAASPATRTQLVPLIKAAHRAPRRRLHRRHQPVRRLQQPRRLDQELRLCARAQRGREPPRRHAGARARSPPTTRPATVEEVDAARRLDPAPAQARARTTTRATASPPWPICRSATPPARSSPACSTSSPSAEDLHDHLEHGRHAAQPPGRSGALPRRRDAGRRQRGASIKCRSSEVVGKTLSRSMTEIAETEKISKSCKPDPTAVPLDARRRRGAPERLGGPAGDAGEAGAAAAGGRGGDTACASVLELAGVVLVHLGLA